MDAKTERQERGGEREGKLRRNSGGCALAKIETVRKSEGARFTTLWDPAVEKPSPQRKWVRGKALDPVSLRRGGTGYLRTSAKRCTRSPHSPAGCSRAGWDYAAAWGLGFRPKPRQGLRPCTLTRVSPLTRFRCGEGGRDICEHRQSVAPARLIALRAVRALDGITLRRGAWGSTPNPGKGFDPAP